MERGDEVDDEIMTIAHNCSDSNGSSLYSHNHCVMYILMRYVVFEL